MKKSRLLLIHLPCFAVVLTHILKKCFTALRRLFSGSEWQMILLTIIYTECCKYVIIFNSETVNYHIVKEQGSIIFTAMERVNNEEGCRVPGCIEHPKY